MFFSGLVFKLTALFIFSNDKQAKLQDETGPDGGCLARPIYSYEACFLANKKLVGSFS